MKEIQQRHLYIKKIQPGCIFNVLFDVIDVVFVVDIDDYFDDGVNDDAVDCVGAGLPRVLLWLLFLLMLVLLLKMLMMF